MTDHLCPSCGFPLQTGHRFCASCGAAVEEATPPPDAELARVQEAVGAEYRVVRLLGQGGFAEVFEAEEVALGRQVAIKMVRPELSLRAEVVERLQREARAIAALRHPNIVEIYAVGGGESGAWFVMPLVVGESLGHRLDREGRLAPEEATRILVESGRALLTAHRAGMVHRDVKPDNILLDGPERRVLLSDFGIAKALGAGDSALTGSGLLVGTPHFMAPEQAGGDPVDHRSDIYALGVVGYRMLAGRLPFEGSSVQAVLARVLTQEPEPLWAAREGCPPHLVSAVGRALAKDPGERWTDLGEMLDVLEGRRAAAPVGRRVGVASWDRSPEGAGGAPAAGPSGEAALARYRFRLLAALSALVVLALADLGIGLGGISAWVAVAVVVSVALRGGRLWREGYGWRELAGLAPAGGGDTGTPTLPSEEGDFGRHRSLVHASVKARAAILKTYGLMPHQDQARFPELQAVVEQVTARVRHLARKVVTLEERIAEASARVEALSDPAAAHSDSAILVRAQGRARELAAARDAAGEELRRVVGLLQETEDALTVVWQEDPGRATEEVQRLLAVARAELAA